MKKNPNSRFGRRKPGIADEVALGVTYNEIDDYLEGKTISPEAQATIENWWHKGQHKRHHQSPYLMTFGSKTSSGGFTPSLKQKARKVRGTFSPSLEMRKRGRFGNSKSSIFLVSPRTMTRFEKAW